MARDALQINEDLSRGFVWTGSAQPGGKTKHGANNSHGDSPSFVTTRCPYSLRCRAGFDQLENRDGNHSATMIGGWRTLSTPAHPEFEWKID
jgi:hypothetical protein